MVVACTAAEAEGVSEVRFEVRDTGIGMTARREAPIRRLGSWQRRSRASTSRPTLESWCGAFGTRPACPWGRWPCARASPPNASGHWRREKAMSELGYAEVCALVRATQPPRPARWSDGFEHDLTVTRLGPPATAEGRRYWHHVAEVRQQLEDSGRSRPA